MSKCVNTAGCGDRGLSRNPAIVRGNDFTLEAHVSVYDASKGFYVPVDLSAATEVSLAVVGRYGKADGRDINATGDKVTARFAGSLSAGPYGVEVLFKDTSGRGRIFERDLFAVVDDSSDATAGTASEGGDGEGYNISVDVRSRVLRIGRTAMVSDYGQLSNKPSIGGVVLDGDKTAAELGLAAKTLIVTIDPEHPNEDGSYTPSHTPQEIRQAFLDGKTVFFDMPFLGTRATLIQSDESGEYNEFTGHVSINTGETKDYSTYWWTVGETLNLDNVKQFPLYSVAEEKKLRNIENNAQKNVQPDWAESDPKKDSFIKNKPTKLSQLTNDKDFATKTEVAEELEKKVDKVDGKSLSTNDYTDEDKSLLASAVQVYDASWVVEDEESGTTVTDEQFESISAAITNHKKIVLKASGATFSAIAGKENNVSSSLDAVINLVCPVYNTSIRLYRIALGKTIYKINYYLSIDTELSETSLKAVTNKAVTAALANKMGYPQRSALADSESVTIACDNRSGVIFSGAAIAALTVSAAKTDGSQDGAEAVLFFSTGTAPAIAVTGVSWANSDTPTFEAGKTYEIHILYNAALDKFLATYAVYE